jgi:Bacterial regulatory protein, Fis family
MSVTKGNRVPQEEVAAAYQRNAGNIRATAKELGIARSTVREKLTPLGMMKKPLAGGTKLGTSSQFAPLPKRGKVKRYIITSAQNNTHVHAEFLANLEALAEHYSAEIIVGTYSYNQNNYGKLAVKRNKSKAAEKELWYDPSITKYIKDFRLELGKGLVWAGEYNALPTNVNPLAGLEAYTGRSSAIFPHAKLAMRSIATMQGEGVKLNYTTGTVTLKNYIQKREGVIAEFHHIYGALLVEVDSNGNWWVRQLNHDEGTGTLQDLDVLVKDGKVTTGNAVEALTFGDLHGTFADPEIVKLSHDMLDTLKPKYQFLHDVMEGVSVNPHDRKYKDNHVKFHTWLRGLHRVDAELKATAELLNTYWKDGVETVIVDSNHDNPWLVRWLSEYDYRVDPANAELFLKLQTWMYSRIRAGKMPRDINVLEYALENSGFAGARFLVADESFLICDKKIECGMHGHMGPQGRRGSPDNLSKMARKANTAHTHSCGIYNGLYVAGTSSKLRWDYNRGPSSWSNTHIVTYSNGKRTLVTMYNGKWRAQ